MFLPVCGLDFGTSNSTIGLVQGQTQGYRPALAPLEGHHTTLPSAVFFNFEDNTTCYGRKAIQEYIEGSEGRLMRSLKSVLGSNLIHDTTQIKTRRLAFSDIIGNLIAHIRQTAEAQAETQLTHVVLGRPVHFVDENPEADREAQNQLEKAAKKQHFQHVEFQFEPIAAALDYEQHTTSEELAFIVDIGGGTSDFSIVRVSPQLAAKADRKNDILANTGVHIGGTDFDRLFSLSKVMPEFGYKTPNKSGKADLPASYYFDLATWQRINNLYDKSIPFALNQIRNEAVMPERVDRLIGLVSHRQGHALAGKVEEAKIHLTHAQEALISLALPHERLSLTASRSEFNASIHSASARIIQTVTETLNMANLQAGQIQAVFLTGGSTQIPLVKNSILSLFPHSKVVEGDTFGSVGLGLTLDALRKFA